MNLHPAILISVFIGLATATLVAMGSFYVIFCSVFGMELLSNDSLAVLGLAIVFGFGVVLFAVSHFAKSFM